MPKDGGIPEKTSDFNAYIKTVIPHLKENQVRLNISEEEMEEVRAAWGEINAEGNYPRGSWNDLYARKINPLTSTSVVKWELRSKRKFIDKLLRKIYAHSVYRMNAEDSAITGRRKRKEKNSRAPVPDRFPEQYVKKLEHAVITFRFRDPKFPSLRRNPPQFRFIQIEGEIYKGKKIYGMKHETTGKSIFRLKLDMKHVGMKLRIRSRYYNRRGQGPWSYWLDTIII